MNKTFKKSDINKYLDEERIDELISANGALINPSNNYKQNRNHIKSKKTTDDFVRNSTQGPEAYFIYGGPYYGINYTRVVNEEEDISESDESMKSLVDEIIRNKKDKNRDVVKRMKEEDIMSEPISIPDISELKDVHEKPIVIRKINSLLDLIHKENLKGDELAILLNHLINNLDLSTLSEEHKELIGDKIKYGEQEEK
jgi:hypothetical protein